MEICRQEVSETMCCLGDKNIRKMVFVTAILRPFGVGAKRLQRSVPPEPTSPYKILSQSVPVCRSYFCQSYLVQLQSMSFVYDEI